MKASGEFKKAQIETASFSALLSLTFQGAT